MNTKVRTAAEIRASMQLLTHSEKPRKKLFKVSQISRVNERGKLHPSRVDLSWSDFSLKELIQEIKSQGVEHILHLTPVLISVYGLWFSYRTGEEKQTILHIRATPKVIKRLLQIIKKGE